MIIEQGKTIQILLEQLELLAEENKRINLQKEPERFHKNISAMVEIAKVICESQF